MKILDVLFDWLYYIDPCGEESVCFVRPACHIRNNIPWTRRDKCPDYKRFYERRDVIDNIKTEIIEWFCIGTMLSVLAFIAFLFILGIVTFIGWFI